MFGFSSSSTRSSASARSLAYSLLHLYSIFILRTALQVIHTMLNVSNELDREFDTADVASTEGFLNTGNVASGGDGLNSSSKGYDCWG